ncbi:GMC oxidoreductase [Mycena pura]|uniref:GMC oxidoreductase n=1 Tax=Mycena pura TaxID=153505 RepID=A0AAD7E1F9_9AGAR|nr:GMC oxidoreductase [Mycena pura]
MGNSSSNPSQFATAVCEDATGFQPGRQSWKTYDYVICGGGAAGCVLASRLSENPQISVLLVEAGKSNKGNLLSRIPLAFTELLSTAANWKYKTVPQDGLDNKQVACDRGKILGGSSSINACVYQRCSPDNFSDWVKAGAEGWDANEMTRYFDKAEKYSSSPDFPGIDTVLHSSSGRVSTRYGPFAPICDTIIDAAVNVGIPRILDMNADKGPAGVSNFAGSVDPKGERSSSATAYLTPEVLQRPNLTIAVETTVVRVVLEEKEGAESPQATGVLVARQSGRVFGVAVRREVIVSAGTVATPQLLMVSGIGPADELEKHKIRVVRHLPFVGKNLLDHFSSGSLTLRAKAGKTWDYILSPLGGITVLLEWLISGTGPMASIAASVGVFVHSDTIVASTGKEGKPVDLSSAPSGAPDIEIFFAPLIVINNGRTKTPGLTGLTIGCIAVNPASKGTITLASSSMFDHPVIDPKYLSDQHDLQVHIKAIRLALRIARAEPLASALALPDDSKDESTFFWPGDADPDTVSDERLAAWIKRNGQTAWHPTSTAKMGASPETSVVDPQLRVHGVAGLRVADASVFPTSVAGHPCAVVIALAEKASDLIKAAQ